MEDSTSDSESDISNVLSPEVLKKHQPNENWKTPVRSTVRSLRRQGKSYGQIREVIGLSRSTIQHIIKAPSSRTTRKGLATKRPALKQADVKRIFRFVSESWTNRIKSWGRIRHELRLEASITTIRRVMKEHGYRRCVACRRPFISKE
jgi:transposase